LSDVLRYLVKALALPLTPDDILHSLTSLMLEAMHADLCVIMLMDQSRNQLLIRTSRPGLSDARIDMQPVEADRAVLERLRDTMLHGQVPELSMLESQALNPLKNVQYDVLVPIPLFAGVECVGIINCYSSKTQSYADDDQLLLGTIASQAALALKHLRPQETDELAQQQHLVRGLFNDLLSDNLVAQESLHRRAYALGCDLVRPHAVVVFELLQVVELQSANGSDDRSLEAERRVIQKEAIQQLKRRTSAAYPGSLVDEREVHLVGLLNLDKDPAAYAVNTWFEGLVYQMHHEQHVSVSSGMSNPCQEIEEYRRGYAEAKEALEIGHFLKREGSMTHFNTLGVYRYIYQFAQKDTLHDQYQEQIAAIADYDRRKKSNLLETLEVYLDCGGNSARACSQLDIHRNTMLQRLERLQSLCSVNLEQLEHRLPLLVALKVYKLRTHQI
jgi:sugar diacid utilization regulator